MNEMKILTEELVNNRRNCLDRVTEMIVDRDTFLEMCINCIDLYEKYYVYEFRKRDLDEDLDKIIDSVKKEIDYIESEAERIEREYENVWNEEGLVNYYNEYERRRYREIDEINYVELSLEDLEY